jgi:phenylalanyl-tRNA synthetase alpha chain
MVDPNVIKHVGYSDEYQGFAWGVGIERLAMLKYQIDHIKNFYDNDLRFLEQF